MSDLLNDRKNCGTSLKQYYNVVSQELSDGFNMPTVIEKKKATVSKASITVDGAVVPLQTYTIDGYTYFKLRDIAIVVDGTKKQFDVSWDGTRKIIQILPESSYSDILDIESDTLEDTTAVTSTAQLLIGDTETKIEAYTINGYTYYKLRDLGTALDFGITWDQDTKTIGIYTDMGSENN